MTTKTAMLMGVLLGVAVKPAAKLAAAAAQEGARPAPKCKYHAGGTIRAKPMAKYVNAGTHLRALFHSCRLSSRHYCRLWHLSYGGSWASRMPPSNIGMP